MTYHPIMGITLFFIFLIIAFFIGRKSNFIQENKKIIYLVNKKNKNKNPDSINPDADWLN